MPIRKYGNEPAKTETRAEDNDQETLDAVRKQAQEQPHGRHESPDYDSDNDGQLRLF